MDIFVLFVIFVLKICGTLQMLLFFLGGSLYLITLVTWTQACQTYWSHEILAETNLLLSDVILLRWWCCLINVCVSFAGVVTERVKEAHQSNSAPPMMLFPGYNFKNPLPFYFSRFAWLIIWRIGGDFARLCYNQTMIVEEIS